MMPGPPAAPKKNYVIVVQSKDPDNALQEGAIINVEDHTLDESLSGTSDIKGEHIEDLANLPSEFSNGNALILRCSKRGFMQTLVSTINTGNAGEAFVFDRTTATYVMGVFQTKE